jgi:hypothetical protein
MNELIKQHQLRAQTRMKS